MHFQKSRSHFRGGQTLFKGGQTLFSARFGPIPCVMTQKSLAPSLDTPQRVSQSRKCGGALSDPPKGGTHSVFWSFLSLGRSVWADSFCNEPEITCTKFRHPTKGIPVQKMLGGTFCPPPLRGDALCFLEFSQLGEVGLG